MESFFVTLGGISFVWMLAGAIFGGILGILRIYEYFVDLKSTLSRIENLIKAEDYTGAEELNHE